MERTKLDAYLHFQGTCEEALAFYQGIFGGEIVAMNRYEGSPMMQHVPADWGTKVMHAAYKSADLEFMASDSYLSGRSGSGNVSLSLSVSDPGAGGVLFGKLAEGGRVTVPFQETFWSPGFGMLVDRYGIEWMVNCG